MNKLYCILRNVFYLTEKVTGMPCFFNVELRQQQTTNLHCTCVYFKLVTVDDLANIVVFNYNPQNDKNEFSLI